MASRQLAKLIERLHDLGKSDPAPIGFGRPVQQKRRPALLLIGEANPGQLKSLVSKGAVEHLDAVLMTGAPSEKDAEAIGDTLWGARLSDADETGLDRLKSSGCDFIIIGSDEAPASILRDDGMARGKELPLEITERQARVLDDLPFDFLTLSYGEKPGKLTIAGLLEYQAAVSMVGKHIVLQVAKMPSEAELNVLRDLPIDAVIVPAGGMTSAQGQAAREAIDAIEPRKPRSHHDDPAIAQSGKSPVDAESHDDGFDDDDDPDELDFDRGISRTW